MQSSDVQFLAGSLAFTTVLSLVPLLAISLSVFSALGGLESLFAQIEPFIMQNLIEASGSEVSRFIRSAIRRVHSGALGFGGAIALLLTSTKLFFDTEAAVQRVWKLKPKRSFLKKIIVYWVVMFAGPVVLAIVLGWIGSWNPSLLAYFPKRFVGLSFAFIALVSIYTYLPNCRVSWRASVLSALIATSGFWMAQSFYAGLTKNMLRYSKIYGSLASVPIFLLWILLLWWICLMGVALTATLQTRFYHSRR